MALGVTAKNVSIAWLESLNELVRARNGEMANLSVTVENPVEEDASIRASLDAFVEEQRRRAGGRIEPVSTVANTIFPAAFYRTSLGVRAREHLYEMERRARRISRRRNPSGTYFERLVAWPTSGGEFNQLERAVGRLIAARERNKRRGNEYEFGLVSVSDAETSDDVALPVYRAGEDNRIRGFPCLSHVSLTLLEGRLHMTALYRNHHFISRAYGNYLGLGRLLSFMARESGWGLGELMCVSSHADAEIGGGGAFGSGRVKDLLAKCHGE